MRCLSLSSVLAALLLVLGSSSCSSSTGSACASAGGTCLLGSGLARCAKQAASSAQDCNTNPPNPSGGFCCLEIRDGGPAQEGSVGGVSDGGEGTNDGSNSDGAPPSCVWPASLDPTDATANNGRCVAGRAYLSCTYSNGTTEVCVSDDPTQCPGPAASANGAFTCQNQCQPDEYAITCGQAGFGGTPQPTPPPPPASCRFIAGAEGLSFGCCPCGGTGSVGADGAVTQDGGSMTETGAGVSDASFCQRSLDAWCATAQWPRCTGDWASAVCNPASGPGGTAWAASGACDGYDVLSQQGIDSGQHYYYDKSTGQLVAIVMTGNVEVCVGGPPDFALPSSCLPAMPLCGLSGEGGTDALSDATDSGGDR